MFGFFLQLPETRAAGAFYLARMVRILLIDDHALVREGVARLLEETAGLKVVGSFDDDGVAVRFAARAEPDVAILDIAMPRANGIDVARRLRAVSPRTRLLVLSMHAGVEYVQRPSRRAPTATCSRSRPPRSWSPRCSRCTPASAT
jgi:DNA-binding NarL/FixJ family response regulator